jgi:hypothetical protein
MVLNETGELSNSNGINRYSFLVLSITLFLLDENEMTGGGKGNSGAILNNNKYT